VDEQKKECGQTSLDPQDWDSLRQQGHRMLDDMLDYLQNIRQRPVWQPAPGDVRRRFDVALPVAETPLATVHQQFLDDVLPYAVGNAHPGFMGWVHGGGAPVGMLAEILAAGLNANLGGRNQIPVEVERQITRWMRDLFGFPASASGVFVTGTSMATLIAVWVARTRLAGESVREQGLPAEAKRWTVYASRATHGSFAHALDLAGLGADCWRVVPVDAHQCIDVVALEDVLQRDLAAGFQPFMLIGNAGTVDAGAIDALNSLADIASRHGMWFHVDGALGALGMLSPEIAPRLAGIERADSLAFDFHKWGQVPYDAGFALIRDGELHQRTFVSRAAYLRREQDGLAGGSPWPCDFGPDLSRGFRALKAWFTLQVYGAQRMGRMIAETCAVAAWLGEQIVHHEELELLVPVSLNIVCFRHRGQGGADVDALNAAIVVAVQNSGLAAPSTTTIQGKLAIRAAIVNHRTCRQDVDVLLQAVLRFGRQLQNGRREG
jgi:glutamate/tyrosine decarboxylase-like PLP-dependent enzyme